MEAKKTKKADLKNKRVLFLEIGFIFAIGIVFAAFQWGIEEKMDIIDLQSSLNVDIEEVLIPITRPEVEQQRNEPPPVVEVLNIVEDDIEIEDDIEMEDTEGDQEIAVNIIEIEEEPEIEEVVPFFKVEKKPEFIGGDVALLRFLGSETKYPKVAVENSIEGKVFVSFVIDETGKVIDVALLRGADPILDREALRVVKSMPNWRPGKQRDKPIKVQYQVPINFELH